MTTQTARLPRFFYRMPPRPCPYLQGRTEQNIFTELAGGRSLASINNANNTYGEWSFPLQKRMKQ